jgi:hypothetical protein
MLGAVYTHYILGDKFERMAPGLIFGLLLLTRLIIHRQVTNREKGPSTPKQPPKVEVEAKKEEDEEEEEEEEDDNVEQESDDQESQSDKEDKQKPSIDKKKEKKNK